MAKRIMVILSLFITVLSVFVTSDLISSNATFQELDRMASEVSYYISKNGGLTDAIKMHVRKECGGEIYCAMDNCSSVKKGDSYKYAIEKRCTFMFIKPENDCIRVTHSVIIGLYN